MYTVKKMLASFAAAVLGAFVFSQEAVPGDILFQPQVNVVQTAFAEGIPLGYVFFTDGTESNRKELDSVLQAVPGGDAFLRCAKLWSCLEWISCAGGAIFCEAASSSSGRLSDSLQAAGSAFFRMSEICPAEESCCRSRAIDNYIFHASGLNRAE